MKGSGGSGAGFGKARDGKVVDMLERGGEVVAVIPREGSGNLSDAKGDMKVQKEKRKGSLMYMAVSWLVWSE